MFGGARLGVESRQRGEARSKVLTVRIARPSLLLEPVKLTVQNGALELAQSVIDGDDLARLAAAYGRAFQ